MTTKAIIHIFLYITILVIGARSAYNLWTGGENSHDLMILISCSGAALVLLGMFLKGLEIFWNDGFAEYKEVD